MKITAGESPTSGFHHSVGGAKIVILPGTNYEQLEQLRGQVEQEERALGELIAPDPPPFIVGLIGPYPPESDEWFLVDAYTAYDAGELQHLTLQPYWQLAAGAAVALQTGSGIDIANYTRSADRAVDDYFSGVRWMVDGLHGFLACRDLAPSDAREENTYGFRRNVTPKATPGPAQEL